MKRLLHFVIMSFMYFNAFSQDLNLSFEKLDTLSEFLIFPRGWIMNGSKNRGGDIITESHEGKYAVRINTFYSYNAGDLMLGNDSDYNPKGVSFSKRIKSLSGWYKYQKITPGREHLDSAQALVFLHKYDHAKKESIYVGQGELKLGKAENYTQFDLPIKYFNMLQPDTLVIIFCTVAWRKIDPNGGIKPIIDLPFTCPGEQNNNTCLYLTIDDLSLQFTTPTKNPRTNLQPLQISPNPTDDKTVITWELPTPSRNVELSITDVLGRTLHRVQTDQNQVEINTIDLPKGMYVVYLRQAGQLLGTERLLIAK